MNKTNKTIFISDLHLEQNHPEMAQQFLAFLQSCDNSVDALYILGDLFEAWIGDDDQSAFNQKIIAGFAEATKKGLPIYVMHGNRDFLLGKRFLAETGCRLLRDEVLISLYDTPVLLLHGDTLCTLDLNYMKARRLAHNSLVQTLFLLLPLFIRKKIAANMRLKSTMHVQVITNAMMDVVDADVVAVLEKYKANYLIHGHTHKRGFHRHQLSANNQAERIVLGAWHPAGNALIWHADGKKELIDLPYYPANG